MKLRPCLITLDAKFKWPNKLSRALLDILCLLSNLCNISLILVSLSNGKRASMLSVSRIIPKYCNCTIGPTVL